MDTKQKRFSIGIRAVFSLLGILIVMSVVIVLATSKGGCSLDNISRAIAYRNLGSAEQTEKFTFGDHQLGAFAPLGDGLLVASEAGYEYYVKSGEIFLSEPTAMSMPTISTAGEYAIVYDIGGSTVAVFDESGVIYKPTETGTASESKASTETGEEAGAEDKGDIISAKVNSEGWSAVCRTASRVKGVVTVYNGEGVGAYEIRIRSGYPISASVSPDGTGMVVLILTDSGTRIVRYDFSSKDENELFTVSNRLYLDLIYTSATTVAVVSEDDILWLKLSGEIIRKYDLEGTYLGGYEIDGDMLLYLSDHKNAATGRLILLASDGTVIADREIAGNVRDISFNGKYSGVLLTDRFEVYDGALNIYYDSEELHSASELLIRRDGTVLLVSAFQATLYVP